jgi:Holliday junction resolvase
MMSNYARGREKEYRIMRALHRQGFDVVVRSAGSHSCIDIVAIDSGKKIIKLIQSKLNIKECTKKALLRDNAFLNGVYQVNFETNEA